MYDTFMLIITAGAVTVFLRFIPFIAFRKKIPSLILYLGRVLPYSVMAMLFVYCLRNTGTYFLPEALSCGLVISLHIWKRNTLLSIIAGTGLYMIMLQYA